MIESIECFNSKFELCFMKERKVATYRDIEVNQPWS